MSENQSSLQELQGRSHFTFPRRELLQRLASISLLHLVPRLQPKYGHPKFAIGDKVADHWIDEFEIEQVEYGEVMGVCWHPREQVWGYLIDWTSGNMPSFAYPCFDEHLTMRGNLRSASHV